MINVNGISKHYWGSRALQDVSLEVREGQIVALVGANGAGKSTLLRILAGVILPTGGSFEYGGRPYDRLDLELRRRIFFVPDGQLIFPDWTILRHLAMVVNLYEAERPGVQDEAIRLLKRFELLEHVEMPVKTLSRGQAYKAGVCAALLSGAPYVLLDEPFASGMDPTGIAALKEELDLRARDGLSVLYTTQILDIAERFSARVAVLHRGRLEAFGSMEELRGQVTTASGKLEEIFQRLREGPPA